MAEALIVLFHDDGTVDIGCTGEVASAYDKASNVIVVPN